MSPIRTKIESLKPLTTELYRTGQLKQPNYALPMVLATAEALCVGIDTITAVEFGVASGRGLNSLVRIADRLTLETGIKFQIFGFDTFDGMPPPKGYRDHPEIWSTGQYATPDFEKLKKSLPANCELVMGNVEETVPRFVRERLSKSAPLGFVSIDVDYHSSTEAALGILKSHPQLYLPGVLMYFDDIDGNLLLNGWAGEELAINEFNAGNTFRKIQRKVSNSPKMFVAHILDHAIRMGDEKPLEAIELPVSLFQRTG